MRVTEIIHNYFFVIANKMGKIKGVDTGHETQEKKAEEEKNQEAVSGWQTLHSRKQGHIKAVTEISTYWNL